VHLVLKGYSGLSFDKDINCLLISVSERFMPHLVQKRRKSMKKNEILN